MSRRRGDGPGGSTWVQGVGFVKDPGLAAKMSRLHGDSGSSVRRGVGRGGDDDRHLSEYERAERADSAPGADRLDRINYMIASVRKSLSG